MSIDTKRTDLAWYIVQQRLDRGEDICEIVNTAAFQCDDATCLAVIHHIDQFNDRDKLIDTLAECQNPDFDDAIAYAGYHIDKFAERGKFTHDFALNCIAGINKSKEDVNLNKFIHALLVAGYANCVDMCMIERGIIPDDILSETLPYWLRVSIALNCSKTRQSHILDALVQDEDEDVRKAVASRGYGLDILIDDKAPDVRCAVARQRYGLDRLVNDKNKLVRAEVAKQGYGLDKLHVDPTDTVSDAAESAIVYHFYGVDDLDDEQSAALDQWMAENKRAVKAIIARSEKVRKEIAFRGRALDKLIYDDSAYVRISAAFGIKPADKHSQDVLANDEEPVVRKIIAKRGFCLEKLVHDEDSDVRKAVLAHKFGLDILIDDDDPTIRLAIAKLGYGLSVLVKDEDEDVRNAVLEHGYGADILVKHEDAETRRKVAEIGDAKQLKVLVNDDDPLVRREVAKRGYGLKTLVNDKDWNVRAIVASKGFGLEKLVDDSSAWVRVAVALRGYETEHLLNDKSPSVAKAAQASKRAHEHGRSLRDAYGEYPIIEIANSKSILPDFDSAY